MNAVRPSGKTPLWLDCDPGHDDAFAILLSAHHPLLELLGISTVYGNASLKRATANALSILQAIARPEVPVFPGASKPFCRDAHPAADIHGESGLDGTDLLPQPSRLPITKCNAITEMRDALMACNPQTAWLVATGSLTNIGLLFATFPEVAAHIRGLSIMGGSVGDGFTSVPLGPSFIAASGDTLSRIGNVTPYAEFNIWCDPESAQSIFRNPVLASKTVLIPLDVTHQAFATKERQDMLRFGKQGKVSTPAKLREMYYELLVFFAKTYAEVFGLTQGPPLHDPIAVAVLMAGPESLDSRILFDDRGGERWDVNVVLTNEQVGRTVVKPSPEGVMIPRSLDLEKFWKTLDECLERANAGDVKY